MTQEDIIRMARGAAFDTYINLDSHLVGILLQRFAALVAAHEREACAKVCDGIRYKGYVPPENGAAADYYDEAAEECAEAIRARGNK